MLSNNSQSSIDKNTLILEKIDLSIISETKVIRSSSVKKRNFQEFKRKTYIEIKKLRMLIKQSQKIIQEEIDRKIKEETKKIEKIIDRKIYLNDLENLQIEQDVLWESDSD